MATCRFRGRRGLCARSATEVDGRCWQHTGQPIPLAAFRPRRSAVERPEQTVVAEVLTIPVTGDLD